MLADIPLKSKSAVTPKYHRLFTMILMEKSAQWARRLSKSISLNRQRRKDG
jgi:hypothetical protein